MIEFKNDDEAYFDWLQKNQQGFVLNLRQKCDPGYVVLHRASCGLISNPKNLSGAYTARSYRKICAVNISELEQAARQEGRADGSFSKRCGHCDP